MEKKTSIMHYIGEHCNSDERIVKSLCTYSDIDNRTGYTHHYWLTNQNRLVVATENEVYLGDECGKSVFDYEYTIAFYNLNDIRAEDIVMLRATNHNELYNELVLPIVIDGQNRNIVIKTYIHSSFIKNQIINHLKKYGTIEQKTANIKKSMLEYEAELTKLYKEGIITFEEKKQLTNKYFSN
jgi:hypothetical protein